MALVQHTGAWASQPPDPAGVDWGNPHARGLLAAVSGSAPVELVNGVPLQVEGAPSLIGSPEGYAGPRFNGTSGIWWAPIPRRPISQWTLLQVVRNNSTAADMRSFNLGNSGSNVTLVALGAGLINSTKLRVVCRTDNDVLPGNTSVETSADAYSNTEVRVSALSFTGASGCQGYVSGRPDGFAELIIPPPTFTVDRVGVGALRRTSNAAFFSGDVFAAFAWDRVLSPAEIADLSANPWQLFEPRRIWVPVASGPSTPVLSAPTVISITATSATPRVTITI